MSGPWLATLAAATQRAQRQAKTPRPDRQAYRILYKELIETSTTRSVGSCTGR